jgi:capsular exopolysaccharide synthesis family protein
MDTSLKTVEEVERYIGLPVVGIIPQKIKAMVDKNVEPAHSEAYRVLRANLRFSEKFKGGKVLTLTSGGVGEGKSLTLFNLAAISASLGDKVIIVDSDLHRPRQHRHLGISNKTGLIDVLMGEATPEDVTVATAIPNLSIIPSGKSKTGVHGLLESSRVKAIIAELRSRYDIVFFDSPPMIGVSDSSVLVREMDGVLFVIQHRKYPRIVSRRAKELAENLGANLVGIVINSINLSRDYADYQYSYEYHRKRKDEKAEA